MIRNETISFLCGINHLCSLVSFDSHARGYFIIALEDSIEGEVDSEHYVAGGEIASGLPMIGLPGETSIF